MSVVATATFSPFVFLPTCAVAFAGMMLWGIGQATQDSVLTALAAGVLPRWRRDMPFGLYAGYGVGWLIGAAAAGLLYEQLRVALVAFAATAQLASVPIFLTTGDILTAVVPNNPLPDSAIDGEQGSCPATSCASPGSDRTR